MDAIIRDFIPGGASTIEAIRKFPSLPRKYQVESITSGFIRSTIATATLYITSNYLEPEPNKEMSLQAASIVWISLGSLLTAMTAATKIQGLRILAQPRNAFNAMRHPHIRFH